MCEGKGTKVSSFNHEGCRQRFRTVWFDLGSVHFACKAEWENSLQQIATEGLEPQTCFFFFMFSSPFKNPVHESVSSLQSCK